MYLLPVPKESSVKNQTYVIDYNHRIVVSSASTRKVNHYAKVLKAGLEESLGYSLQIIKGDRLANCIYLSINENLRTEEYTLTVSNEGIEIQGGDDRGVLHGVQTLRQVVAQKGATIPQLEIRDYPTIPNRGFYHDVTRGRIPTLSYLKSFADKLSYYKINQLQLYVEHSFLFQELSEMWRDDTPLTGEEIMELDEYCANLNIELVPSLSTFGHLFKLLDSKTYKHLCELDNYSPEDFSFIDRMRHHTIDVSNRDSILLIKKMIDEFLPLFSSNQFNICADETFDLGKGKSKTLADKVGVKNMYVDYVQELCEYLIEKGKRPMFWGDIICGFPELIKKLPEQVICLNWGYAPEQREYETEVLHKAGATQYLCPGVGGWNKLINLINSSYRNITLMSSYANKYNALGFLNTDWGDFGHINHPEFSTTGMIYGAAFSWNESILPFEEINKQISALEYKDSSETFLSVVSAMSDQIIYGWDNAIYYKEEYLKMDSAECKERFFEVDFTKVEAANAELTTLKDKLYGIITSIDTSKRHLVKPYIVASEGIGLLNKIGATIAAYIYDFETSAKVEPAKLAGELEMWFYSYKEVWRTTSKESELFRIQEVINWFADYLRDFR